jgi:ankyrin repeat protein
MPLKKLPKSKADPIFAACESGDASALSSLIATDPGSLTKKNSDGWTPLICAAFNGELGCVEMLLASGADARAACKDGDTAVHYASAQGHADVIAALARVKGVSLTALDNDGESPADVAQNGKIKKLLEKLIAERDEADDADDGAGDGEGDGEDEDAEEDAGAGAGGAAGGSR